MLITSGWIRASGSSQQDSLQQILKTTTDVETTVRASLGLADLLKESSPDSCHRYLDLARNLFWRINALPYLGQYFEIKGDLARKSFDFSTSDRLYQNAVFCYEKTGERPKQIRILNMIGSTYAQSGNVAEAFRYYLRAREYASDFGETEMLARIDNNLGRLYCTSENYLTGIEYYKRALAVFEKDKDPFKIGTVCMNLGNAYFHISVMDTARIYSKRARRLFSSISKKYYAGTAFQTIAFTLISDKRYPEALIYLDSVHTIAKLQGTGLERMESKFLLSDVTVFTGVTHCLMHNYSRAKKYLIRGYFLSDSLGMLERAKDALEFLAKAYEKPGRPIRRFTIISYIKLHRIR
jgi:tetratricopeptide (TPR) repeat protein